MGPGGARAQSSARPPSAALTDQVSYGGRVLPGTPAPAQCCPCGAAPERAGCRRENCPGHWCFYRYRAGMRNAS
jgi:hypothetical protein